MSGCYDCALRHVERTAFALCRGCLDYLVGFHHLGYFDLRRIDLHRRWKDTVPTCQSPCSDWQSAATCYTPCARCPLRSPTTMGQPYAVPDYVIPGPQPLKVFLGWNIPTGLSARFCTTSCGSFSLSLRHRQDNRYLYRKIAADSDHCRPGVLGRAPIAVLEIPIPEIRSRLAGKPAQARSDGSGFAAAAARPDDSPSTGQGRGPARSNPRGVAKASALATEASTLVSSRGRFDIKFKRR